MKNICFFLLLCVLFLFGINAYAYNFKSCQAKAKTFMEKVGNSWGVAISPDTLLYHSSSGVPKGFTVIKRDPFIGLYLLKSKSNRMRQKIDANNSSPLGYISIKEITNSNMQEEMGSFTPAENVSGKIAKRQSSPIDYASLNVPTLRNSAIGTVCDQIYGIGIGSSDKRIAQLLGINNLVGNRGEFLEIFYINRFLNQDKPYYGNIGVSLKHQFKPAVVSLADPFYPNNPFKKGDVIISVDSKPTPDASSFYRVVFDLPQNAQVPVTLLRDGQEMQVNANVEARRGGLLLPENLFDRIGLRVSPSFTITEILANAKGELKNLRKGDKVLRVNNEAVPSGEMAILDLMSKYPTQEQTWLIQRNNFQFFMRVNTSPNATSSTGGQGNVNRSDFGDSIIDFDMNSFAPNNPNVPQENADNFGEGIMDLDVNSFAPRNANPPETSPNGTGEDSNDVFDQAPMLPPRPRT